jgi:hypothetical protein
MCQASGQQNIEEPHVLHIQQSQTTSEKNFPTFLAMYHVLDGAKSPTGALALTGTISLKNYDPTSAKSSGYWSIGKENVRPMTSA